MRHIPGAPIVSKAAARANLRRHVAEHLDGRYHHPAGGTARKCPDCDGTGLDGLDRAKCSRCRGTGVEAQS